MLFTRTLFHFFVFSLGLLTCSVYASAKDLKNCVLSQYSPQTVAISGLPDPSTMGSYKFKVVKYGKKPSIFSSSNPEIITQKVKLPSFLAEYSRSKGYKDDAYHKFNNDVSLDGKVWLPNGKGPFPLVLITHGNSDPGFDYLAELLASRGYLVAQVDQTYLNGLWGENGARGWVLLEHLKLWRQWSSESKQPFFGKVDMENVALIGMSRGGEAVALATTFNQWQTLPHSDEVLDLGFNIRAVVALAPMDGQYLHTDGSNVLKNTNYLVLQGGHDADVYQFLGSQQWQRTSFDDGGDYLKQLVYFYRGNHINFNQSMSGSFHWGKRGDFDAQLLTPTQQEKLTKVLVSAFLEASILKKVEYRQLFKQLPLTEFDLPEDIYISRYITSDFKVVEDFENSSIKVKLSRVNRDNKQIFLPVSIEPERLRYGVETPNQVLRLNLARDVETHVRMQLPSQMIKSKSNQQYFNFQFSLARTDASTQQKCEPYNLFSETKVEVLQDSLLVESISLGSIGTVSPLLLSDFSELERGDVKYAQTEPVLQTFSVPVKVENIGDGATELDIIFKPSQNVTIILDDFGVTGGTH
ncbi:hypothetical protein WLQ65_11495 [Pseudoalteromonas piscicida]|uniref:alpha/beta hydrolase family protein n=1 Tax=Pseudoalteromonas piscicida TaxID=43662 RepID=UPI0030C8DF43